MGSIKSYRELVVWQRSMDLSIEVYRETRSFPSEEKFGVTSQMRRAATSVSANIAEGQARRTRGEFLQALGIARGSLAELETFVILCQRLGYLNPAPSEELLARCEEVSKLLSGLMKSLSDSR
jgi:four helix bundle protein